MKIPRLSRLACAFTVAYAALAGLRTLADFDLWWQLAAGRYWFTTGHLARQDVFSYTASGAPWIYPPGAGILFYALFRHGGFALLSLLAPAAAAGAALLLVRRGGLLRAWTVALAVPVIAWRTSVRAELFNTVLLAAFLVVLWEKDLASSNIRKIPLWTLPVLMLAWVNLHPGFIVGLGLLALFLAIGSGRVALWAILTALATLANPWGWRVYTVVFNQGKALRYQQGFIGEWLPVPVSWQAASNAFRLRDPESGYWLLLGLAVVAIAAGLRRRGFVGPALLAATGIASLTYFRFQALFAVTAAAVVPDLLASVDLPPRWMAWAEQTGWLRRAQVAATGVLAVFLLVRTGDLASNHYYLSHGDVATFGAGVAGWFPERAVRFLEEHKLPRELYHDYNLGGYLGWRAWPEYRVFIDGRALPFGPELFFLQQRLAQLGPEAQEWQQTLDRWKIRTLLVSVARFGGYGALPLKSFCESRRFRLVYLDETAAVFVQGEVADLAGLDCRTVKLSPPPPTRPSAERFHFYANAGKLYYALERDTEAEQAWEQARQIFPNDPSLHLDLGQLRHAQGRMAEAEQEFRRAIALRPTATSWFALGDLLAREGRFGEAAECFRQSAARASLPHEADLALGQSYLSAGQARRALEAFDEALRSSPFQGPAESLGRGFTVRTLLGRAGALLALRDASQAVTTLERAISLAPSEPNLRLALAEAYLANGRLREARRALAQARKLGADPAAIGRLQERLRQAGSH